MSTGLWNLSLHSKSNQTYSIGFLIHLESHLQMDESKSSKVIFISTVGAANKLRRVSTAGSHRFLVELKGRWPEWVLV